MATTQNRRSLGSTKRQSSENGGVKATAALKKRPPLTNLTNQIRPSSMVPCTTTKSFNTRKDSSSNSNTKNSKSNQFRTASNVGPPPSNTKLLLSRISLPPASTHMDISPTPSKSHSVSMDESMSTCDSLKSPEVEYLDENDVAALVSIQTKASISLHISGHTQDALTTCKRDLLSATQIDKVVDVDDNYMDPQFCSTIACDIYNHLRASETQKRPSTDFMETIQKDINTSMRAILIDWLVEVAEEYRLVPDTLYLTVNYIDRYLSGNAMNRQRLQLLGVACMMVAAKYEEICAPQVEEFCYITDNTYFKEEVLQMESAVLNFLKFEMTAPTTKCFLRRFVRAAQVMNEIPSMQLECLANYLAELSLLEYNMLQYSPSLTAASAVFLAKYILCPSHRPWNSTLQHYTLYEPSDLQECVQALHQLCLSSNSSSLPAIREKYSQHKYKFAAKKYCPSSIPLEYFMSASG